MLQHFFNFPRSKSSSHKIFKYIHFQAAHSLRVTFFVLHRINVHPCNAMLSQHAGPSVFLECYEGLELRCLIELTFNLQLASPQVCTNINLSSILSNPGIQSDSAEQPGSHDSNRDGRTQGLYSEPVYADEARWIPSSKKLPRELRYIIATSKSSRRPGTLSR